LGDRKGWLVGWDLTALLTQFRSYRTFKVKTIANIKDLIEINSRSKVRVAEKTSNPHNPDAVGSQLKEVKKDNRGRTS